MLSLLRPGDVPDAQPKNKNHVGKNGQHATCSCITRNGKPQERRRCKIHQNPTPASNNYHVEGKKNGVRNMLVHNKKWQPHGSSTMQDSSKSNTCQQQLSRGRKKKRTARNMLVHNKKWQPHGSSTMQDSSKINKADPGSVEQGANALAFCFAKRQRGWEALRRTST
mmetsp:Transcript_100417/g.161889  ORF Transcript_100417/g.161889 Transcript_100417/m.161889 type:complete len:167 (-) Transcript_100417:1790-2290(-)